MPPILNTPESDITATSELGVEFSGIVEINTPDLDPSSGLVELPDQVVDVANLINQGCSGKQQQSKFVVTGRGGLPPSLAEAIANEAIVVDWVTLNPDESLSTRAMENVPVRDRIVEATGWVIGANGKVILTAGEPTVSPHNSRLRTIECP